MAPPKKRANEPEPRPIIVKKIIAEAHGGHHGGAWKVAYADFVTAMMAFFLLMWLLGATTEKQRKSLADYFTPTLVTVRNNSAGSNGLMGGDSLTGKENYPTTGGQGNLAITIPRDSTGTKDVGGKDYKNRDRQKFEMMKKVLEQKLDQDNQLKRLKRNIRFRETNEGLRIDLVDEADFSMFGSGTDRLVPEARALLAQVAQVIAGETNDIIVRGSTDASRYGSDHMMNNWLLSAARAEATRVALSRSGVPASRFIRIEGVADRDPFIASSPFDPRNRRMAVILAWSRGASAAVDAQGDTPEEHAAIIKAIEARDNPRAKMARIAREADMGGTALPKGAIISNVDQISRKTIGAPSAKPAH